jgi:hypothetical protein
VLKVKQSTALVLPQHPVLTSLSRLVTAVLALSVSVLDRAGLWLYSP